MLEAYAAYFPHDSYGLPGIIHKVFIDQPLGASQMALTLLAERRKPSGECLINTAKPEGSRPAATRTQSQPSLKRVSLGASQQLWS